MNIDASYQLTQFCCNKSQQGNVSPSQFNVIAPVAQISVLNKLLGNENELVPGRPVPRYGFLLNQKILEDIRPLIKTPTSLPFVNGVAQYPEDCLYIFAIRVPNAYQPAEPVEFDEAIYLEASKIKPPTVSYPKHYVLANFIYILPSTITDTDISYVRRPLTPKWNHTIVNQAPVFNPSGSQDFELGELTHLRIVSVILQMCGINLNLYEVTKFAQMLEQEGA